MQSVNRDKCLHIFLKITKAFPQRLQLCLCERDLCGGIPVNTKYNSNNSNTDNIIQTMSSRCPER